MRAFARPRRPSSSGSSADGPPKGLAPQLGLTVEEAQAYIDRLHAMMPDASSWIEAQKRRARKEKEACSLYDRKRRFPMWPRKRMKKQFRQAVNMPVQSSVSDMTLLANIRAIRVYWPPM